MSVVSDIVAMYRCDVFVVVFVVIVVDIVDVGVDLVHNIRSQTNNVFRPRLLVVSSLSAVDLASNGPMCCRQPGNVDSAYRSGLLETERLQSPSRQFVHLRWTSTGRLSSA